MDIILDLAIFELPIILFLLVLVVERYIIRDKRASEIIFVTVLACILSIAFFFLASAPGGPHIPNPLVFLDPLGLVTLAFLQHSLFFVPYRYWGSTYPFFDVLIKLSHIPSICLACFFYFIYRYRNRHSIPLNLRTLFLASIALSVVPAILAATYVFASYARTYHYQGEAFWRKPGQWLVSH